ncbi:MAG: hypothetical protein HYV45_00315 [Candidatus Moranbacteria bacterium]|nr:hypothetical protein [Candidatus Moranbacteria bacterium]
MDFSFFRKFSLYSSTQFVVVGIGFLVMGVFFWFFFTQEKKEERDLSEEPLSAYGEITPLSEWVDEEPVFDSGNGVKVETEDGDEETLLPPPPPPIMERMKAQGCVTDGFLSGYGGDINSSIALVNRSKCYYLHRALETWLRPPDFKLARKIQKKVTKPNTVYGMFIAEAIDTKANYHYPAEDRDFDFSEMCRSGSKNYWGEHTCKPSLEREEYRKYVQYIAEQAMDMGIQSFLFGQVFYQDTSDLSKTRMPEIMQNMREYADFRGIKIFIGAQTNDITDENYLRLFDYIEGGVGLASDGSIEEGPCFSRWWKKPGDWCWALLWHEQFSSRVSNVFLHFDWSGKLGDDMDVFTKMNKEKRAETLRSLHQFFLKKKMGFLLPMLATLHKDDVGCHGPKKRFYSASRKYSCQDEDAINAILSGR